MIIAKAVRLVTAKSASVGFGRVDRNFSECRFRKRDSLMFKTESFDEDSALNVRLG